MVRDANARYRDEGGFFKVFFSRLDQRYPGISRRWEKEAERAESSGHKFNMGNVWWDGAGYIWTLEQVQRRVTRGDFSPADVEKLAELASKVVKRREEDYLWAESCGKSDPQHRKPLEEWKRIEGILQPLRSRPGTANVVQQCAAGTPLVREQEGGFPIGVILGFLVLAILAWILFGGKK